MQRIFILLLLVILGSCALNSPVSPSGDYIFVDEGDGKFRGYVWLCHTL